MKLYVGSDHGGFALKKFLLDNLSKLNESLKNSNVVDFGCTSDESVNYPDFAAQVCAALLKEFDSQNQSSKNSISQKSKSAEIATIDVIEFNAFGILICGSGQGMAMKANKYRDIRAALAWNEEIAKLSREHNNANVLCLPGRFIEAETALKIVQIFISTRFSQGRHSQRVEKINNPI